MQTDRPTGYTGPDRRRPVARENVLPYIARVTLASATVTALWFLLVLLARRQPQQTELALIDLARSLSAAFLLAAAALRFAAWRITGLARAAWSAVVLAVGGIGIPVVELTNDLPGAGSAGFDPSAIPRDLVHLTLICLGTAALVTPDVVARLRPMRIVTPFMLGCLVISAVVTVRGTSPLSPGPMEQTITVTQWGVTVAWIALAAAFVTLGLRRHRSGDVVIGAALVALAAGSTCRVLIGPAAYRAMAGPAGVMLFATAVLVGLAAMALWQLQTGRGTRLLRVTGALHGARVDLQRSQRDQAGRLHDARTAILAVGGATRLLAHPESANGVDRDRLQDLVSAERHRLGVLLDPNLRSVTLRFRPADVIEPLVLAHRLSGADVTAAVGDRWALGSPEATATAVANLLSNARAHAPGSHIWITAETAGTPGAGTLSIAVADDGPGIPEGERDLVLELGVRGSAATGPGSGIGLASAAGCMAAQGGSLSIGARPGGGTVVRLTLPLAPDQPPVALDQSPVALDQSSAAPPAAVRAVRAVRVTPDLEAASR